MKKFILLILLITTGINYLSAQKFKYGYINADKVLQEMPEITAANTELKAYIEQINEYITAKNQEYLTKLKKFKEEKERLSEFMRKEQENDLAKIEIDLKQFKLNAQKEINQKKAVLYQKAINKLKAAVQNVAKENGYRFIIDNSNGVLLFFEEQDNVEPLVRAKLGLQ